MRLLLAPFLLTFALLLTGCATTEGPRTPLVDQHLLHCKDAPLVPTDTGNSKKVANYIVDLHGAYSDCKAKLGAVAKVVTP